MATAATATTTVTTGPTRRRTRPSLLLLLLLGCSADRPGYPLAIRWSFADGRSCTDTGVTAIQVFDAGSLVPRAIIPDCLVGLTTPQSIGEVESGERSYDIEGVSASGGVLYRGRITVDAAEHSEADVVLSFSGG